MQLVGVHIGVDEVYIPRGEGEVGAAAREHEAEGVLALRVVMQRDAVQRLRAVRRGGVRVEVERQDLAPRIAAALGRLRERELRLVDLLGPAAELDPLAE